MIDDQRKSPRLSLAVRVKVIHPSFGELILKARDISDGGMFIFSDGVELPSVGAEMQVQALDTHEEAMLLKVRIVHALENGVGVMFSE